MRDQEKPQEDWTVVLAPTAIDYRQRDYTLTITQSSKDSELVTTKKVRVEKGSDSIDGPCGPSMLSFTGEAGKKSKVPIYKQDSWSAYKDQCQGLVLSKAPDFLSVDGNYRLVIDAPNEI